MRENTLPELPAGIEIQPRSWVDELPGGAAIGLTTDWRLAVVAEELQLLNRFEGEPIAGGLLAEMSPANARTARALVPWLNPIPVGLACSAGLGDRLGLATPGHLRAIRAQGGRIRPIPAQQSIREMTRTRRTPQQVMDDATWGVLAEGWRDGWGGDADHLKTPEDIDGCAAVGFTQYTFDPGAHVRGEADTMSEADLAAAYESTVPWTTLEDSPQAMRGRYGSLTVDLGHVALTFTETEVLRAAIKYGGAVAHVASLYRHLASVARGPFEVEVSVDETDNPTTPIEHAWIAREMRRLGVEWIGLAPRFLGRFEKGVDYIGDMDVFLADFRIHAAIARALGPYKLSLHSGSDKFSIYAAAVKETGSLVHLKTAGTSFLEALRTVGEVNPALFDQIYRLARERYPEDRATYHVSASLDQAPPPGTAGAALLDDFHARQILHVTFGSVLDRFGTEIKDLLRSHREEYATNLEHHLGRHLAPFAAAL